MTVKSDYNLVCVWIREFGGEGREQKERYAFSLFGYNMGPGRKEVGNNLDFLSL